MTHTLLRHLAASCALFCPALALACTGALHIELEHSGVYALDHAAIVAAQPGLANCSSDELILTVAGEEVPLRIHGGEDGRFGPGDRIEWIGKQLHGPMSWFNSFSIDNVYLLSAAPGQHARMRELEPSGNGRAKLQRDLHFEQENLMIRLDERQQKPGEEPDVWQWVKLTHADPQAFSVDFDLPDLHPAGANVAVTLNFRGLSSLPQFSQYKDSRPHDHAVMVSINGRAATALSWDGRDESEQTISLPAAALKAKGNSLSLQVPKRLAPWDDKNPVVDVVMFNWITFGFEISGDLDRGALPFSVSAGDAHCIELKWDGGGELALYGEDGARRIGRKEANGRFRFAPAPAGVVQMPALEGNYQQPKSLRAVAEGDWLQPSHGYDYLIVTHASLAGAIAPLAAFHESRGMKVATLDIEEVYDHFNHGLIHPQAIRNLVQHATEHWPEPKPRFLLLVGDASFDIRHDTADDLRYAKFANHPGEMAFAGHFLSIPGTSYEAGTASFASRNMIPTWQFPSPEGQSASDNPFGTIGDGYHPVVAVGRFPVAEPHEVTAIVKKTIDYLSKPQMGSWRRDVMFITDESEHFKKSSDAIAREIGEQGFMADKIYASRDEGDNLAHQSAIKDGLNEGQLLVHFIGHGGRYIWRTGPPDLTKNHDLFTLDDVSSLSNSGRLPMVLSMTCYSAPFDNPTEDSIGERFLREPDKGAVAVFAASWRNSPSPAFSQALIEELLLPGATIGEGIVRAKGRIKDRVLIEMYNLLGDPAVVLERPQDYARVALSTDRWKPGLTVALPGQRFSGLIDVDWLDADGHKLATSSLSSEQPRFHLPWPTLADGQIPAEVRLYAANHLTHRDATASLDLAAAIEAAKPVAPPEVLGPFAEPRPLTPDTITRMGFEVKDFLTADEVP